jgi:para-nitrobenzyl esterase
MREPERRSVRVASVLLAMIAGAGCACGGGAAVDPPGGDRDGSRGDAGDAPSAVVDAAVTPDARSDGAPPATSDARDEVTACEVGVPGDALTVATDRGLVRGVERGATTAFFGIPYAAAPTGELRFRPPVEHACWDGVRPAEAFGAKCIQAPIGRVSGDEDCLFLNVWAPALGGSERRPVLFWIHGGAEVAGSADEDTGPLSYDGRELAEREGVVVVTTNYRLGALGWLAHPALSAESELTASGNYGLLDLIQALEWVQRNIAAFGGDPARVMMFGESAGGINTFELIASPLAAGLFSSAIVESGVATETPIERRMIRGIDVGESLGCGGGADADTASCLRSAPARDLAVLSPAEPFDAIDPATSGDMTFGPAVDGWVLPRPPLEIIAAGEHNRVPIVIGSNGAEYDFFVALTVVAGCTDYAARMRRHFGDALAEEVIAEYPCTDPLRARDVYSDALGDLFFTCEARRIARAADAGQDQSVYRYWFTHRRRLGSLAALRAAHSFEIPFVFRSLGTIEDPATPAELALSETIQGYWSRHAAAGDPNGAGAPVWEPYHATRDDAIELRAEGSAMIDGVESDHCDFWDAVRAR